MCLHTDTQKKTCVLKDVVFNIMIRSATACQDRLGIDIRKMLEREGRFSFRTVERRGGDNALVARPAVGEINGRIVPELRKMLCVLSCPYICHEPVWVNQSQIGQKLAKFNE